MGLLADRSTKIVYQEESSEATHTAQVLGRFVTERNELPGLERGEGLWRVGQRTFVVRHLVTDGGLKSFDTKSRMCTSRSGARGGVRHQGQPGEVRSLDRTWLPCGELLRGEPEAVGVERVVVGVTDVDRLLCQGARPGHGELAAEGNCPEEGVGHPGALAAG